MQKAREKRPMRTRRKVVDVNLDSDGDRHSSDPIYVLIYLIVFDFSCLIYMHDSIQPFNMSSDLATDLSFQNLVVGMNFRSESISSSLIQGNYSNSMAEDFDASLSQRLARRFNLQVFVSTELSHIKESRQIFNLEKHLVTFVKENFE